jgi:hypothetical protein
MANLVGQGPTAAPFATSEYVGTSVADPRLGTRWKDNDGNEYQIVDFQQALVAGEFVVIDSGNLASRLTATSHGRVGVVCGSPTTSDTKGYVQIYGLYAGAAGTSGVATSNLLMPNASWFDIGVVDGLPTSSAGGTQIYNAFAYTAADSATTSPASSFVTAAGTSSTAIGFSVWLAYPYVVNAVNAGGTT